MAVAEGEAGAASASNSTERQPMNRDRRNALLLIGGFAALLIAAFLLFGGFFGMKAGNHASLRQAFAEATPTPKENARKGADAQGEISSVEGPRLEEIRANASPTATPLPVQKEQQKKVNYEMIQFYTAAPKPIPQATPVPDPKLYLPRATLIPCSLVLTVDSSSRDTPVLGEVTQDVKAFGGTGQVVIPAGTLVAGFASPSRIRDRVEVKGSWDFIFKSGKEYEFRGVACDRIYDYNTGRYGLTDGSAGLHGSILFTDRYAELKAFGAAALAGVAQSFQTVQSNSFGNNGNSLEHTPQNAGLQGLSNVTELMVQKYMSANDGDETYVRVPAGKEFYVYSESIIEPTQASVGAYGQNAKAQTVWEKVQIERQGAKNSDVSPELKSMLNGMAKQQAELEKLKAQTATQPQPSPSSPF
jgi:hypothetical protein